MPANSLPYKKKTADNRRFKNPTPPSGRASGAVSKEQNRTKFVSKVSEVTTESRVLKSGENNRKIGGDVLVGHLYGAKIYTLTLEERATCPKSCPVWSICYGNNMQWPTRWRAGVALEKKLEEEVASLCARDDLVLIRLHVLGDFYSIDYVRLWARLLDTYPNLYIFGFSAWYPATKIGGAIQRLREALPHRFAIRTSHSKGRWGTKHIRGRTYDKEVDGAIVCPEQRDSLLGSPNRIHCGNCAACWSCNATIAFMEH